MQVKTPLVSIIILNWNGLAVTIDCLESLFKIDYGNFNVVLVDNGSIDKSVEILRTKYEGRIDLLDLGRNTGFTGGNNIGLEFAIDKYNSDYYLLLNNDTVVKENFLTELVNGILESENYYAAVPKIYYFEPNDVLWFAGGHVSKLVGRVTHYGQNKRDQPEYNVKRIVGFMNGCAALISAKAIKEIGILDEQFFANSEDADYSLRIIESGHSIIYVPQSVLFHKVSHSFNSNKGKWFGFYMATRNIYLLQRKHLSLVLFPIFLLLFSVRWMFYLTVRLCFEKDLKSAKYLYIGLWDGITNKLRLPKL